MLKFEEIVLPIGLRRIGRFAFHNCCALRSIVIPSTVMKMGDGAFNGCDNLESAEIEGFPEIPTRSHSKQKWSVFPQNTIIISSDEWKEMYEDESFYDLS